MDISNKIFQYLRSYRNANNKFPTIPIIQNKFSLDKGKVIKTLKHLAKEKILTLNNSRYIPGEKFYSTNIKSNLQEKIPSLIIIVIRITMAIISIGACILSVWFTATFLMNYLHPVLAYVLSVIMILFSVMAFETIIIFFKNKQIGLVSLFSFLWLIVLCFSMFSTVMTQYDRLKINENQEIINSTDTIIEKESYNRLLTEEKEIIESIELKKDQLTPYQNILNSFVSKEDRKTKDDQYTYWNASKNIKAINKEINILKEDLKIKRNEIEIELKNIKAKENNHEIISNIKINKQSSFQWISNIFNINIQYVKFWPFTFPAVFVDIIAPLALAISMFLKRKENKEDE